jgi:hypothetical protein
LSAPIARKVCPHCGSLIPADDKTCPRCGVSLVAPPKTAAPKVAREEKSTRTAGIASIIFPGLGQLYLGETRKGISFIVVAAIILFAVFDDTRPSRRGGFSLSRQPPLFFLFIVVYLAFLIYAAYDASSSAKKTNEAAF